MRTLILLTLLFGSISKTMGASCEALKGDVVRIQKAQLELKAEDDMTLAQKQNKYNALMSKLAILDGIKKLRNNYKESLERLNRDRSKSLDTLLENIRKKTESMADIVTLSTLMGDIMLSTEFYQDKNLDSLPVEERPAYKFYQRFELLCGEESRANQHMCANLPEYERLIKDFYYAYVDLNAPSRARKLEILQRRLTDGLPGLDQDNNPSLLNSRIEIIDNKKVSVEDKRFETMLVNYKDKTEDFNTKISDLESHLRECAQNSHTIGCDDSSSDLQTALHAYHDGIDDELKQLKYTENLRHDLNREFGSADQNNFYDQITNLFNTNTTDSTTALSNSTKRSLKAKLLGSLKLEQHQLTIQGAKSRKINTQIAALENNNGQQLERIYYKYLIESGSCETGRNYNKDNLNKCLVELSADNQFNEISDSIDRVKSDMEKTQEEISQIKKGDTFKKMEEMKIAFLAEARNNCSEDQFVESNDTVKVCTDGYFTGCMSSSLNSVEILGVTVAEVEKKLGEYTGAVPQANHQRIEDVCKDDTLRELASATCVGTTTRNQVTRRYDTYYNGNPDLGKKKSFGNIFNQALSEQLPSSTMNFLYWKYSYPMTIDSMYSNAIWQKQMVHTQGQWYDLQNEWIDLNGYSNTWGDDSYYNRYTGDYFPIYY